MEKTHVILAFEFPGGGTVSQKFIVGRVKLERPIQNPRFIKINCFQPNTAEFMFTTNLVKEGTFFQSEKVVENGGGIIGLGSGTTHSVFPFIPVKEMDFLNEVLVLCCYQKGSKDSLIENDRRLWVRLSLFIFHGEFLERPLREMSASATETFFLIKLPCVTQTLARTVFKLEKPIFGAKAMKILHWNSGGGGFDIISTNIARGDTFETNDPDIKETAICFGFSGATHIGEWATVKESLSTLNEFDISVQKTRKAAFPNSNVWVFLCIKHEG